MELVSTPDNPVPDGGIVGIVKTKDGVSLRCASWTGGGQTRGTVCLCQGRTEFIEKYFEVVRELRGRGYGVVTFDLRGQGLSDRALSDPRKGHVDHFSQYDTDLDAVMEQVVLATSAPPFIGLAHSIGGAVLLRSAARKPDRFERVIVSSPMIGLPYPISSTVAQAAVRALRFCGFGTSYVPGGGDGIIDLRPFASNRRTSDPQRYARTANVVAARPALGIGSPTIGWTAAALDATREFEAPDYARAIRDRLLIVAAGADEIVSTAASAAFAERSGIASFTVIDDARHELLVEQDRFRAKFWSAFDSFAG